MAGGRTAGEVVAVGGDGSAVGTEQVSPAGDIAPLVFDRLRSDLGPVAPGGYRVLGWLFGPFDGQEVDREGGARR
jgi:hypothetical protein